MNLYSSDFDDGGDIPVKFTCQGEGLRPSLSWSEIPENAQSLALSIVDPDAVSGEFVHYLLSEIPADTPGLESDDEIGHEISNTTGKGAYVPPCPPSGKHHYHFTLYTLDVAKLSPEEEENFFDGIKSHVIDQISITGLFGNE